MEKLKFPNKEVAKIFAEKKTIYVEQGDNSIEDSYY